MALHIKYVVMLALTFTWAAAAAPLPPRFTGTWGTVTLQNGAGTKQIDLYLDENGAGWLIASATPARNANSTRGQAAGLDGFIAMPIEAVFEGDILTTRGFTRDPRYAEEAARMTLTCRYDAAGPVLTCADPNGVTLAMQYRSDEMTADVARMQAIMREQLAGQVPQAQDKP